MNLYKGVKRIYIATWVLWAALLWGLVLTGERQEPLTGENIIYGLGSVVLFTVVIPAVLWWVIAWILRGFMTK